MRRQLLRGAAAGAAGTTALNAVTYLDMLVRARPASTTPEESVRRLVERDRPNALSAKGPDSDEAANRRTALGALMGIAIGVGAGAVLGAVRPLLGPRRRVRAMVVAALAANLGGVLPMWALGVSDPREWSAESWLSDLLPHLVYGVVTAVVYDQLDHEGQDGRGRRSAARARLRRISP
ncbi:hypothetical protein [Pseudonocardia sp.]|jgi:hypothetical protein|uniref:hypothetical protein n=1 Tax=Pseudonocardia sp. TaxID=60912 RepID=UPI0031FD032E